MAEAFVAQNPDRVQPNHPAQIRLKSGSSRPTKRSWCRQRDLFLHGLGDELRSVVGADVTGDATQDEEVGQNVDHIDRFEFAGDTR